jgi:hypothetical protein
MHHRTLHDTWLRMRTTWGLGKGASRSIRHPIVLTLQPWHRRIRPEFSWVRSSDWAKPGLRSIGSGRIWSCRSLRPRVLHLHRSHVRSLVDTRELYLAIYQQRAVVQLHALPEELFVLTSPRHTTEKNKDSNKSDRSFLMISMSSIWWLNHN